MARDSISLAAQYLLILTIVFNFITLVNATVTITSSPNQSPAVFQAGENLTLTCSTTVNNPTFAWTSTFTNADGVGINPSDSAITGIFLHGHNTGSHTCSVGSESASYVLTVTGTTIWYNNPTPGHLIHNNTAISVHGMVNEIRCYSGDTNSGNTGTTIISPSGNTPLQFSNVEAGYKKKSGSTNVGSVDNGVYTCKYVDGGGIISESSFAVYSRTREPGSGSGNTVSLEVMPLEYNISGHNITVTCTSNGWPATQVIWSKDGNILNTGGSNTIYQIVMDRDNSAYQNVLFIQASSLSELIGTYKCEVKTIRHNDVVIDSDVSSVTIQSVGNVTVAVTTVGSTDAGDSYTLNCTVTLMENSNVTIIWQKGDVVLSTNVTAGVMLGSLEDEHTTFSKALTLSPLRLSHSGAYSCKAYMNGNVGTAVTNVEVQVPQPLLVLDPSDTIIILGTTVTLTCTVSVTNSLSATVTAITWYKDGTLVSNGVTNTLNEGRSTLSLGTILSNEAGNYTCSAQISSPYIDDGSVIMISNSTNITVQMPDSNSLVLFFVDPNGEPYHAGTKRELQCLVNNLDTYNDPTVTVSINFLFNGSSITNNGRRSFENLISIGSVHVRSLKFTYLVSSLDTGEYTCVVSVTSSIDSSYVVDSLSTQTVFFTIEAPTSSVSLTPFSLHLPNHANYNQVTFNCTGTVPLLDDVVLAFDKVFVWTLHNNDVTNSATTPSTPRAALSFSTLPQTFSIAGQYELSCRVNISVTGDPMVSSTNNTVVTVTSPSSPNKPINVTAVNILYNGATITWIVSSITYTPEQYTIQYGLQSNVLSNNSTILSGSTDFSSTNNMFSISLTNLIHDTTYYYHVTATNTEGSINSDTKSFKTREKPPTAPPTNFVISSVNSTALSLAWNPPPQEHRNGLIIKYTLTCYETVNGSSYLATSPIFPYTVNNNGSIDLVLNGFRPGTIINCSVTASNDAGTGPAAHDDTITQEQAPAGPPRSFSITNMYSRELTAQWLPPDPFLQYGIIISYTLTCYEIESKVVPSSLPRVFSHPPPAKVIVDGLRPFTMYNCTVVANNSAGQSRPASESGMTEPDVPDGSPSSFSLTVTNSTTLKLSWKPVPDREQNGIILNYTIGCNTTEFEPTQVSVNDELEMTDRVYSEDIYGLTPGTTYECYVFANSTEGAGPPAKSINRTFEERPGSSPHNVIFSSINSNSIIIKWNRPLKPNGFITQYTVYITKYYFNGTTNVFSVTVFETEYEIMGLSPYQLIEVQVSAWTAIGEGPRSNLEMTRTLEEAPGPVEGIEYHPLTSSILLVNWTNQSLLVARGIILQYQVTIVQYTGENRQLIVVNGTQFEVQFSGLRGLIPYVVKVIAINTIGPGEPVNYIIFTEEGRPPPPENITVSRINQTAMSVSWTPIDITIARGKILHYIITYSAQRSTRQDNTNSVTVPNNQSQVTIGGLQAGVTYIVTVNAATSVGESNNNNPVTVPTVPPMEQSTESSGLNLMYVYAGAGAAGVVILVIIVVIIIVIIIVKKKSKSPDGYNASAVNIGFPMEDEKIELKDLQSLNGEVTSELEPITTPELIPMDERMKPIPRSAFSQHVKEMHRDRDKGFELEYQSLNTPAVVPHEAAKEPVNRPKNRFANIYPYDFSRVPLSLYENLEGSDYINASYMDGYNRTSGYIAAQGPLPNTLSDFWRMIWEHKLDTIVMLTKCIEAGKRKCEQYWPDEVNETLETPVHIDITLTSITPFADFQMRKFRVIKTTEHDATPLEVTHWHFLGWPDHGCPQYATSLISFIRHVRKHYKRNSPPVLVHCSAGVGRTGTFILLDSMLERLTVEDTINVYELLKDMRKKRVFMVQTLAQYVFIHDALDELITCGETDIPIASLKQRIAMLNKPVVGKGCTGFESQYQLLEQVCRKPNEVDCSDGLQPYNRNKNRYPDRVPYNITRARLRPTGAQGSEYINASFVDGYKLKNAYIATQGPLQATVHDFWRMIWEFKSKAIVLLCNPEENGVEVCYPYWPTRVGEPLTFNRLIVTLQSENDKLGGYIVRKMEIKEDKPQPVSFVVTQFHFKDWAEHTCPSTAPGILTLLEDLNKVQRNTGNKSITVMCNDGQGRTGAFMCLHAQQDRIKAEGVLDVFHFIKSSRIQRSRLVSDLEQFIFCHQVLQEYYEKFDVYSNFK